MPVLDAPLRTIADAANFSRPWFVIAGLLAAFGGPSGRRAAVAGVVAIGVTSFVVNQPMKLAGGRRRPERAKHGVPASRWVTMPTSTSFPSGHSASAATFAVAVGDLAPSLRVPLGAAASAVCFSRVYTGVHYPGGRRGRCPRGCGAGPAHLRGCPAGGRIPGSWLITRSPLRIVPNRLPSGTIALACCW